VAVHVDLGAPGSGPRLSSARTHPQCPQCLRKVLFRLRWAHTLNCIPPLAIACDASGDDTRKLLSLGPLGQTLGDRVESASATFEALPQSIVQLARNALALGELCSMRPRTLAAT